MGSKVCLCNTPPESSAGGVTASFLKPKYLQNEKTVVTKNAPFVTKKLNNHKTDLNFLFALRALSNIAAKKP